MANLIHNKIERDGAAVARPFSFRFRFFPFLLSIFLMKSKLTRSAAIESDWNCSETKNIKLNYQSSLDETILRNHHHHLCKRSLWLAYMHLLLLHNSLNLFETVVVVQWEIIILCRKFLCCWSSRSKLALVPIERLRESLTATINKASLGAHQCTEAIGELARGFGVGNHW